jgi:hypothetical protein
MSLYSKPYPRRPYDPYPSFWPSRYCSLQALDLRWTFHRFDGASITRNTVRLRTCMHDVANTVGGTFLLRRSVQPLPTTDYPRLLARAREPFVLVTLWRTMVMKHARGCLWISRTDRQLSDRFSTRPRTFLTILSSIYVVGSPYRPARGGEERKGEGNGIITSQSTKAGRRGTGTQ